MRKAKFFAGLVLALLIAGPAAAEIQRDMRACLQEGPFQPKRQTVVLIDGSLMQETAVNGTLPFWRSELARFIKARSSETAVLMAPHEHISLGVLKPDGTGVNLFFEGCLPLLAPDEIEALRVSETKLDWFLGKGWDAANQEMAAEFEKAAARAVVPQAPEDGGRFADSALIPSLRNFVGVDLHAGIPRLVLISDLSPYAMPDGTTSAVVTAGHLDGKTAALHLGYAELHLVSKSSPNSRGAFDYARAFFLEGEADLKSLATAGGALTNVSPPVDVRVFQGSILMKNEPELRLPIRMRIAWDQTYTVVNSWMEETQVKVRYSPFRGNLSCSSETACSYTGDGVFAQIWTTDPDGEAECVTGNERLPFGGYRGLTFDLQGETIKGVASDEKCLFSGMDNGLPFELREVPNGRM